MIDPLTIKSALSSLKTAADIAKTLLGVRDESQMRATVIDLQSAIISAQTDTLKLQAEQSELLGKIRGLETDIVNLKAQLSSNRQVPIALRCPMCSGEMKVKDETPDPHFDFAGVKIHHVECGCGHKSTRTFRAGQYEN